MQNEFSLDEFIMKIDDNSHDPELAYFIDEAPEQHHRRCAELLSDLYELGLLGNVWIEENKNRRYSFHFREDGNRKLKFDRGYRMVKMDGIKK